MTSLDFQPTQTTDTCTEGGLRAESATAFSCESQALFKQATTSATDTSCKHVPSLTIDCGPGTNIKIPGGFDRDVQIHVNGPSQLRPGDHDHGPGTGHRGGSERRDDNDRDRDRNDRQEDCDSDKPPVKSPRGDHFPGGPGRGGDKHPDRPSDRDDCDGERDQRRRHHGDPDGDSGHRSRYQREDFHAFMRRMEEMFSRSSFSRYSDHHAHRGSDREPRMGLFPHETDYLNRDRWNNRDYNNRRDYNNDRGLNLNLPEDFIGRILANGPGSVLARGFDQSPGRSLSQIKDPILGVGADVPLGLLPSPIPGISTRQFLQDAPSPKDALNPIKVAEFAVKEPLKGIKNLLKGKLF